MEIGTTLYVQDRRQWRSWLARHHQTAPEIWLIYYKKHSGKPRIPYNDAVEEALCYGWIDSITKPVDEDRWAQRPALEPALRNEPRAGAPVDRSPPHDQSRPGADRARFRSQEGHEAEPEVADPSGHPDGHQAGSHDLEALPDVP